VASYAPLLAGSFLVATMATLSLPGTNSFVSEFLTLIGSFPARPIYTIFATVGIILAAIYILLMFQRTMTGPPSGVLLTTEPVPAGEPEPVPSGDSALVTATLIKPAPAKPRLRIRDLSRRELAVVTPLVALIIALGFYQQPLIDLVRPAVAATISDVGGHPQGTIPAHPAASTDGGK